MPEIKQLFKSPRCQHVHYNGKPCKAPARRGRNYCVFHQAAHLDPGGCVLPIIEDVHSYQLAVIRIARALADDIIDSRKATALLYALQLAGAQLQNFAKQRAEIEDPHVALKNEVAARYEARRYPFPSYIPEKELLAIFKDMSAEHRPEPGDNIETIPQQPISEMDGEKADDENEESAAPASPRVEPCETSALTPMPPEPERDIQEGAA